MQSNFGFKDRWYLRFARKFDQFLLSFKMICKVISQSKVENEFLSDSQHTRYETAVKKALKSERYFSNFRRKYVYRQILEHSDPKMGGAYLAKIYRLNDKYIYHINEFKKNDSLGNPHLFTYEQIGKISPSTLRYISVAAEIESFFGSLDDFTVAEIGIGYGGQLRILDQLHSLKEYYCFDLESVQQLTLKYLQNFNVKTRVVTPLLIENPEFEFDLVISNYAFSELPFSIQSNYLEYVIKKSKRGYMIMNSGRENVIEKNRLKYKVEELYEAIPNLKVFEESPKSGVDNYLLVWQYAGKL